MNSDAIWVGKKIYDEDDGDILISSLDKSQVLKIVQADHLGAERQGLSSNILVIWGDNNTIRGELDKLDLERSDFVEIIASNRNEDVKSKLFSTSDAKVKDLM